MRAKLLIVDDEPEVLKALERLLRNHFDLYQFDNAHDALVFLKETHCHLILSDMKLPKMSGAEFLSHASKLSPLSKQIVLTGHADIEEAKKVVNNANVSRYFTKPWKNKELLTGLSELVAEYKEDQRGKRFVNSLKGSNSQLSVDKEIMTNAIENMLVEHTETNYHNEELVATNDQLIDFSAQLVNLLLGDETGHNYRIAQQAKLIVQLLGADEREQKATYLAGLYYSVGVANLPESLKNITIDKMTYSEKQQWVSSVSFSAALVRSAQALNPVADIIQHIYEHVDGTGFPDKLKSEDIPLGAKALSLVIFHDQMLTGKVYQYLLSHEEAMIKTHTLVGSIFDTKVVSAFETLLNHPSDNEFEYAISPNKIVKGMVASQDLFNHHGQRLLAKNVVITEAMLEALQHYQEIKGSFTNVFVKSKMNKNKV
jgi:response regulator RpfG family c-di-GMP phosphodiesterase